MGAAGLRGRSREHSHKNTERMTDAQTLCQMLVDDSAAGAYAYLA